MKKCISICLIAIVLLFSSCAGGIKGDEAKALINDFFEAVEKGAYGKAETSYVHPDYPIRLMTYIETLEDRYDLDFSDITIQKYTNISAAYYDSDIGGSSYGLTMDTLISGKKVSVEICIIKNDSGYGISSFTVNA